MLTRDKSTRYRMHALRCLEIAGYTSNPENRPTILAMSRAWHALAEQDELAESIGLLQRTEDQDGLFSEVDGY